MTSSPGSAVPCGSCAGPLNASNGSVRARASKYCVSGKALVAATRRALDDATIQGAEKGALGQKDMGGGLRSWSQGSNRPKMIASPYALLSLASPRGRACPAVGWAVSKDPATCGLEIRNWLWL